MTGIRISALPQLPAEPSVSLVDVYETLHSLIEQAKVADSVLVCLERPYAVSVDTDAARELLEKIGALLDTSSSNSRQCYIDTGQYLTIAEAFEFRA